jgi:hypothetical protein
MTIFGFNTDVKHGDMVYHVQSEARQNDLLLQTLVFVKGQCMGKHTVSYARQVSQPEFSTEGIHELLKAQHKSVLDAIQQGRMESVLGSGSEVQDVGGSGLSLQWTMASAGGSVVPVSFRVADSGLPATGAEVAVRGVIASDGELARGIADNTGLVELRVPLTEEVIARGAVMVEATYQGKSATRKMRLRGIGS